MQDQNIQGQLWNAGIVSHGPRSHHRGASPVTRKCAEPGCNKMRRLVQGARYCDEHARGTNYALVQANCGTETATCSCGQDYKRKRLRPSTDATVAWYDFCPDCRFLSPLNLSQLQRHKVPYDTTMRWLAQRDQLCCERPGCGRRFTRGGKGCAPHIDHDHDHCHGRGSCGECVRAVVCQPCNFAIGQLEYLFRSASAEELSGFIKNRCT